MTTQEKGPSFLAKRKKLNNEIMSRGFDLYRQTNISQIDANKRFWLIIFTKPVRHIEALQSKNDWTIRFWIWDSQAGCIAGENVLQYPGTQSIKNSTNFGLAECYVDEKFQRLVMRPRSEKGYFIFSFPDGGLLHHTKGDWEPNDDKSLFYSRFIDQGLFFCLREGQNRLYILSQLITREIKLGFGRGIVRTDESSQFFYEGLEDMKWIIFSGTSISQYGAIVSIYKRLDRGNPDEIYLDLASNLYTPLSGGIDHIEVKKDESHLTISVFSKLKIEKPITATFTDLI